MKKLKFVLGYVAALAVGLFAILTCACCWKGMFYNIIFGLHTVPILTIAKSIITERKKGFLTKVKA